jgi:hypothetical protein
MKFAAALACLALAACARAGPPQPSAAPATALVRSIPSEIPIRIREPHIGSNYIYLTEQKRNRVVYVLRADSNTSVRLSQGSGRSDFVNPHVTFHGSGKSAVVADAPRAHVEERDRSVLMTGGVYARNNEGMTIRSDTMRYDDAAETLHGEGNVLITTRQGEQLRGRQFDYDLRSTEMHVTGDGP